MKKIKILIVAALVLFSLNGVAQDTLSFYRLPTAAVSNLNDQVPVVQGDSTVRMTLSLFTDHITDSIGVHRDSLDSFWDLIQAAESDIASNSALSGAQSVSISALDDTVTVFRTALDNATDSIAAHRTEISANTGNIATNTSGVSDNADSITAHRTVLDNHTDSIAAHLARLDNLNDSIDVHRGEINVLTDSSGSYDTRLAVIEAAVPTTDHGILTGLAGDDHTQYHTDARAAVWLATQAHSTLTGSGDSTHAVIDAHLGSTSNPHSVDMYDAGPDTTGNGGKYLQFVSGSGYTLSSVAGGGTGGDTTHFHTDTISEFTAAHGVLIDGLLVKDGGIGYIDDSIQVFSDTLQYLLPYATIVDAIKDSSRASMSIGTINEYSVGSGVTIDGVNAKDGDVTVTTNDGGLYFDTDTYIKGAGDDYLSLYCGTQALLFSSADLSSYRTFRPYNTAKTLDLGLSNAYWGNLFVDSISLDSTNVGLGVSGWGATKELQFTDPVTGTKTLAELAAAAASADSSYSTITTDTINELTSDHGVLIDGVSFRDFDIDLVTNSLITCESTGGLNFYPTQIVSLVPFRPNVSKTTNLGHPSGFWDNVYGDRYYVDSSAVYLDITGSGATLDMTFTSPLSGTQALNDLIGGGGGGAADSTFFHASIDTISELTAAHGVLIDGLLLKDGDINLTGGDITFGGSSSLTLYTNSIATYDPIIPSASKTIDLGSSSAYFDDGWFDRVYVDSSTVYLDISGWGTSKIMTFESPNGYMFYDGGSEVLQANGTDIYAYTRLSPYNTSKTIDLGTSTNFWDDFYADRVHVDSSNVYLDVDGWGTSKEMTFTDPVSGTKKLSDLARDTVRADSIIRLLSDETLLWCWDLNDSAQMISTRWAARFYHHGPDTLAIVGARAGAVGTSPNFSYNVAFNDSLSFTGDYTKCWTTDLTVTGTDATTVGEVDTSPNNASIPPGNYVFLFFNDLTERPEYGTSFNVYGYEY